MQVLQYSMPKLKGTIIVKERRGMRNNFVLWS